MSKVNSYKNRIFLLTGFMASGKTYLGRKVAKILGYSFIDLDEYIERKESKSIPKLFEENGEKYFREKETSYFSNLIKNCKNTTIIAVGGGFPLKKENQNLMKEVSVIFVDVTFDVIKSRLNNYEKNNRPLIKNADDEYVKKLYENRLNEYKSSGDYIIENEIELITLLQDLVKAAEND